MSTSSFYLKVNSIISKAVIGQIRVLCMLSIIDDCALILVWDFGAIIPHLLMKLKIKSIVFIAEKFPFLADRTNGHAIGTVLRPSVVCCSRRVSVSLYGIYCG